MFTTFAEDNVQTIAEAFRDICAGQDPWVALGDFSHDFFGNYPELDQRVELVKEPLELPAQPALELQQWAAFCAASVEYLCQMHAVPIPEWVNAPQYTLSEPFYTSPLAYKPRVRERLEQEAPEAFRKRNVFCSERVYANKYERLTA
jgi:hypothetical protein